MKFYIADAFTHTLFGGNPAGVVVLGAGESFPDDKTMRKTAAELRYSETAFIRQLSDNEFNIRYFTPADEVELCGHATIASFKCLADAGLVKAGGTYINKTLAGELEIQVLEDSVMMEMASPKKIDTLKDSGQIRELYEIMGLDYGPVSAYDTAGSRFSLLPELVSTGLPDIIMPVASRKLLDSISPDFTRLARLSEKYSVTGVHAFTLEKDENAPETAHCRNFAPLYEIDEEAATGTANGALTYYLFSHGLIADGSCSSFVQGEVMGRPSVISSVVRASQSGSASIQVGGSAVILAKGDILIG